MIFCHPMGSMSSEVFEHNWSRSYCFQVNPAACCDLSVFLYQFEVHSIDSSKTISDFPEVLNFNGLILKLNRFIGGLVQMRMCNSDAQKILVGQSLWYISKYFYPKHTFIRMYCTWHLLQPNKGQLSDILGNLNTNISILY